ADGPASRSRRPDRAAREGKADPAAHKELSHCHEPCATRARLRPPQLPARGLPLPRNLRLRRAHDLRAARGAAVEGIPRELGEGEPRIRPLEEPDRLRRADDRVAGREGGRRPRGPRQDRARDLQPAPPRHEPRPRRDHALRPAHPADAVADGFGAGEHQPLQHAEREHHRAAADADRESRARVDPGGRAPGGRALDLLRTEARPRAPLLHGELRGLPGLQGRARVRVTRVALLGRPVAESLSPRMQNAAFAAAGLDWEYSALEVDPGDLAAAVRSIRESWAGANVTIPHKQAVVELCDEAEGESVNTLVLRNGRVLGFNTDVEIVAGIEARRVCLIGAG